MKIVSNIYYIVGVFFLFAFFSFTLHFSGIYPYASFSVVIFFILFISTIFMLGFIFDRQLKNWLRRARIVTEENKAIFYFKYWPMLMIVVFFLIEILYNRKIPIIEMVQGRLYDYREFTFPGLHVFFTSLTTFYCIKSFFDFLAFKDKRSLVASLVCIFIFCLMMYRSNIMFCVLNYFLLYALYCKVNFKRILKVLLIVVGILYLFGIAGDLRSKAQTGDNEFSISNIMSSTQASLEFQGNTYLSPLYWAYLYLSSPVANFQQTVNLNSTHSEIDGPLKFVVYEMLPDIAGKRIATLGGYDEEYSPLSRVINFLTVGTIFADSFVFIGWYGPLILSLLLLLTPVIFLSMCPKNKMYYVQLSICTIILVLCTFSNMLVYSTLSLQLFYPLIFRKIRLQ